MQHTYLKLVQTHSQLGEAACLWLGEGWQSRSLAEVASGLSAHTTTGLCAWHAIHALPVLGTVLWCAEKRMPCTDVQYTTLQSNCARWAIWILSGPFGDRIEHTRALPCP